jgi:hypothetical protein
MDNNLDGLEQLLTLINEREEAYAEYTEAIADVIRPTVLAALQELLNIKDHQVEWSEIYISMEDLALHIICTVTYGSDDVVPAFVTRIAPRVMTDSPNDVRVVRIGIPIAYSAHPKDEILEFLHQLVDEQQKAIPEPATVASGDTQVLDQFNLSKLTKDQVAQLLVFQHLNEGVKH